MVPKLKHDDMVVAMVTNKHKSIAINYYVSWITELAAFPTKGSNTLTRRCIVTRYVVDEDLVMERISRIEQVTSTVDVKSACRDSLDTLIDLCSGGILCSIFLLCRVRRHCFLQVSRI